MLSEVPSFRVMVPDVHELYTARQELVETRGIRGEAALPLSSTTFHSSKILMESSEIRIAGGPEPRYGIRGTLVMLDNDYGSEDYRRTKLPHLIELLHQELGIKDGEPIMHNPIWSEPNQALVSVSDDSRFLQWGEVLLRGGEIDLSMHAGPPRADFPRSFRIDVEERFRRRIRSFANIYGFLIRSRYKEAGIPIPSEPITLRPLLEDQN